MRHPDELAGDTSAEHESPMTQISAADADLDRADRIARLMDAQFKLPIINMPIGLDGLIGLIPGIGDAVVLLPSAWMLQRGWHHGARKRTLARMGMNSGIDFVIGAIPLVGDIFDIGFKANLRNAALLRKDLKQEPRR